MHATRDSRCSPRAGRAQVLRYTLTSLWRQTDAASRRRLLAALLLMILSASTAALTPLALKYVVDGLEAPSDGRLSVIAMFLVVGYALGQWTTRSLGELKTYIHATVEQRLLRGLSQRLFGHVLALPMGFHLDRRTGAIGETLSNGLLGYRLVLQHLVFSLIPVMVELVMIGTVLIGFGHAEFFAILSLSAGAYGIAITHGLRRIAGPGHAVAGAAARAGAVMTDVLLNCEMVKTFQGESAAQMRYEAALAAAEQAWQRFHRLKCANGLAVATIMALTLGASLFLAARAVAAGSMSLGDFVLVNTYVLEIMRPLDRLAIALRDIAQGLAFLDRMACLMRTKTESLLTDRARCFAGASEIAFESVSFSYGRGRPVLAGVTFRVSAGGTVALVGASGAGKSTIVRLLLRFFEPQDGQILLDGVTIRKIALHDLRHAVAIVPQDTILFNDTIAANIAFARRESSPAAIERAARQAHIHDFIRSLPDGYDTIVGERGLKLSGGERQRIAIARAALAQPRIWVFDEATAALDATTEREILVRLPEITQGATTLLISHRLPAVMHADEILVLRHGAIAERGRHADLLNREGAYAALWRAYHGATPHTVYRGAGGR